MANGAIGAALALGDVIAAGEELYSSYKQQEDLGKMGVTWGDEFAALNPFNSEEAFQARMAAKKKAGQYHPELRPKPKAADEEPKQEEEKTPPQTRADDSVAVEAMLGKYDGLVSKISEAAEKQNQFDKAISDLKSTGPIDRYTSAIERVQQVLDAAK